ncbi:hypothetical protein N1851_027402 [Merluccius polli]|uniref:Uncharacterized protein n=1 Tax=Merluccius polli TaxID=89951 RepID=A0AA47MAF3_MERPO|nr:hypothetical protein N1851_027402 [Merluccius polli]
MVALLFQTAHYSTMGFSTVPLPLSCTSQLQTWHRPRTQGIAPEATNDMRVCKPKKKKNVRTGAKCTLYRAYAGPLPDPNLMASGEKLKELRPQPGICKLLHGLETLNLVDSKFGPVPFGSVLSYQCPPDISREYIRHHDAPAFPRLPVDGYNFKFPVHFVPNYRQQCHLENLKVTLEISAAIEAETRQESECQLWTPDSQPAVSERSVMSVGSRLPKP